MRFKGKKPIASYKDTFCLKTALNPIIGEAVRKFIEVKNGNKSEWFGVPTGALLRHGLVSEKQSEDLEYCDKVWDEVLEKISFAFNAKAPDISDYDFDYDYIPSGVDPEYGQCYTMQLREGTEAENERYDEDMKEYERKVKEGMELFCKFYDNLWW
jgi:hypothetical protein